MAQPTHNEIQAVDPVLTQMLVSYSQADSRFVAGQVFPSVSVDKQGFTYYIMTKKYWFLDSVARRAVGGKFARGGYGVETSTGKAELWGLEHPIADEARANNQMPMSLEQSGTKWLSQQSLIRKEVAWAADFMVGTAWANHDNNSATDWDSTGNPISDITAGKRTISNATGFDPNTLVVGYIVHEAILNNSNLVDRIKYVQMATQQALEAALAATLGVERYLVGKASYNTANEGQAMSAAAIIDDDALLCYVSPTPGVAEPSAGYTFAWAGGGGTGEIVTYRDQTVKSDILQLSEAWDLKVVASDLGYFWTDIV